jgi:AraC family L-rhamnose operon regulatory protein RhaS
MSTPRYAYGLEWTTAGREIHGGKRIPACFITGENSSQWQEAVASRERWKLIFISSPNIVIRNSTQSFTIFPPAILFLPHEHDLEVLLAAASPDDKMILFHPRYIDDKLDFHTFMEPPLETGHLHDRYFLARFDQGVENSGRVVSVEPVMGRYLGSLFDQFGCELDEQQDGFWPCRARSYLLQILIMSTHLSENKLNPFDAGLVHLAGTEMMPVLVHLIKNLANKITVNSVAEAFNTNRTTLQKNFHDATGTSLTQYLIRLRVQTASVFLRNTSLSIPEIMERTGFVDETHFGRMFRKYAARSPKEFRKSFVIPEYILAP